MKIIAIIPARYESTRFPGKSLAEIHGKTMIQRVYEQVSKSKSIKNMLVATDDRRILNHVQKFGGKALMTKEEHESGTERCFEALKLSNGNYDFVLNIQGDEPFIQPEKIDLLAACLDKTYTELATLARKIDDYENLFDPNCVRVVLNENQEALYFTRSVIPYLRDKPKNQWVNSHEYFQHIGLYAYRVDVLESLSKMEPSKLEIAEKLEQLRWLEKGYKIKVEVTQDPSIGIDTLEDLKLAVEKYPDFKI